MLDVFLNSSRPVVQLLRCFPPTIALYRPDNIFSSPWSSATKFSSPLPLLLQTAQLTPARLDLTSASCWDRMGSLGQSKEVHRVLAGVPSPGDNLRRDTDCELSLASVSAVSRVFNRRLPWQLPACRGSRRAPTRNTAGMPGNWWGRHLRYCA